MSTQSELIKATDKIAKLVTSGISAPDALTLHNQTVKINAKLTVLNKFESELKEELNILNEKIKEIERNETTGKNNSLANLKIH